MKLLINASNLKMGGSLQVAHSFIHEIIKYDNICFHIVLSEQLAAQIDRRVFPSNFTFYVYSMKVFSFNGLIGRNRFLSSLEKRIRPDCVFTIFGPTYWSPSVRHVVGFADGWCYYPESLAFRHISRVLWFKRILMIKYKVFKIRNESDVLIVETKDARDHILKLFDLSPDKIHVVGNTYHSIYNQHNQEEFDLKPVVSGEFRLLTLSAGYPHKNLGIINPVSAILQKKGLKVRFYVTLDTKSYKSIFRQNNSQVTNLGPVKVKNGPSLYRQVDALFLPTLLETFTSSYPEAMKMGKPILTSDLSFARDICGDTAEYFNPVDAEDIALKIEKVILNPVRRNELIERGKRRVLTFETSSSRAEKYLNICRSGEN
jgi:glycosyltransferase involved in cell wall biosynthesis